MRSLAVAATLNVGVIAGQPLITCQTDQIEHDTSCYDNLFL